MKISVNQHARFWRLFRTAWEGYARGVGLHVGDVAASNEWRREQIKDATGQDSLKDVDRTHGYDALMLHFAMLAGDESAIRYFAPAVERRTRHLIHKRLAELSALEGRVLGWEYLEGLAEGMRLPRDIEDCPAALLMKAFMALDKHVRRIRTARGDARQNRANTTREFGSGRARKERAGKAPAEQMAGAA